MRISAKAEYACLALIELARPGGNGAPRRVRDIAEAQGIPERYLVQILLQLKAVGLVQSARGTDGGYVLARSAEAIPICEVITAIEGPGDIARKADSPAAERLAALIEQAREAQQKVLAATTIRDLAVNGIPYDWVL